MGIYGYSGGRVAIEDDEFAVAAPVAHGRNHNAGKEDYTHDPLRASTRATSWKNLGLKACFGERVLNFVPGEMNMATAKSGDPVTINYTGKLENGAVFDSTEDREPLRFVLGQEGVISALQEGIVGMNPGDAKTIEIPAGAAFGPRLEELILKTERSRFPEGVEPQVGQQFQVNRSDGSPMPVTVVEVEEETVTLDANHPLAGEALTYTVSLVSVG